MWIVWHQWPNPGGAETLAQALDCMSQQGQRKRGLDGSVVNLDFVHKNARYTGTAIFAEVSDRFFTDLEGGDAYADGA